MLNIKIIAVGKLKEKYLVNGISEYQKRLTKYCKIEIVQVPDEKIPDKASVKQEEEIKYKEGQKILSLIPNDSYVTALCIEGDMPDSVQLSNKIQELAVKGKSHIVFVIGGSLGLSEQIKQRANWRLSFSRLTFPHQLMRMILMEQVYRAFKILSNETYHK